MTADCSSDPSDLSGSLGSHQARSSDPVTDAVGKNGQTVTIPLAERTRTRAKAGRRAL